MTEPKAKRKPAKPRKITDEGILAQRQEFIDRREALEQAREAAIQQFNATIESIDKALSECEGERKFWRRSQVNGRYQMAEEDVIREDGQIVRADIAPEVEPILPTTED